MFPLNHSRRAAMLLRLVAMLLACVAVAHAQGLPAGWGSQGIGSPGSGGNAAVSGGTWTVSGGGADIWNASDQFQFTSRTLRGDGSVVARVNTVGNTSGWAKSGVMLRGDTGAGAAFAERTTAERDRAPRRAGMALTPAGARRPSKLTLSS